jgi:RNA polymerase sigma-70 factor (ECF subfamily)
MGPEQLSWLIDQHAAALELYATQWCSCPEDAVQEALIDLAGCERPPEDPVAWLYRAVRWRAINAGRAGRRRRQHEARAALDRPTVLVPPTGETLDAKQVATAVDSLPDEEREVVVARLWGQLSFRQIGQLTGTSESTAHRRYRSALLRLRERVSRSCTSPNKSVS